jgi:hypothetical protein
VGLSKSREWACAATSAEPSFARSTGKLLEDPPAARWRDSAESAAGRAKQGRVREGAWHLQEKQLPSPRPINRNQESCAVVQAHHPPRGDRSRLI